MKGVLYLLCCTWDPLLRDTVEQKEIFRPPGHDHCGRFNCDVGWSVVLVLLDSFHLGSTPNLVSKRGKYVLYLIRVFLTYLHLLSG